MIYYYIFLFILLVIYFLFAYELKLKVSISFSHLSVKVFFIPIIYLKGSRYKKFLKKLIPENKEKMKEEIDISSLITLVHFDYLNIIIKKNVVDYLAYSFLIAGFDILNNMLIYYIKENIKEYNFKIEENEKNNIDIDSKFHFNLGIILLNLFIINRRYKNVQKANKWNASFFFRIFI